MNNPEKQLLFDGYNELPRKDIEDERRRNMKELIQGRVTNDDGKVDVAATASLRYARKTEPKEFDLAESKVVNLADWKEKQFEDIKTSIEQLRKEYMNENDGYLLKIKQANSIGDRMLAEEYKLQAIENIQAFIEATEKTEKVKDESSEIQKGLNRLKAVVEYYQNHV